ncbi:uncharacterized protein K460DRAFT_373745 [Cucurbitaria berberidis CBS 394.84]|uniref:Uncharacterized protein n=1 Tax=Cucurbitaria berberidis CBS 394.84 TaxID=1168544 RepID=A0A9P4GVL2_9PLEO|nr:uncharacterized protein K460DRAFT_373745 [Cucurbitaria berberidis CBS 394.84]KAF1851831.1 hypothetical protein K460DRAFT_373745 [Cucurbitaria berberidis CBS 394.84]
MSYVITLVFSLVALVSALPTTTHSASASNGSVLAEQWLIPRLHMHIMSDGTGIPGNPPWPDGMRFNSTIDFDVLMLNYTVNEDGSAPAPLALTCQASWRNGTLPDMYEGCTGSPADEMVAFRMGEYTDLGDRRPELSFVLDMVRVRMEDENRIYHLSGSIPITANDPYEPSSYLTCLLGPPYDGLRCAIKSYLSVDNELIIKATSTLPRETGSA